MIPEAPAQHSPLENLHLVNTGQTAMNWSREAIYDHDGR
jgi:hypothetical protein